MYAYRLTNTGFSSLRYGNCEKCHKPADSMYLLAEMRRYKRQDGTESVTYHKCINQIFGHKSCLAAITERRAQ